MREDDKRLNDWHKHQELVLFRLEQNETKIEKIRTEATDQFKIVDKKLDRIAMGLERVKTIQKLWSWLFGGAGGALVVLAELLRKSLLAP